jgi:hypothetical protein
MPFEHFHLLPDQPRDVARFERLMLVSLMVGVIVAVLMSHHVVRHIGPQTGAVLITILFSGAFLLTLLASRRASRIARWLLAIGTVVGLVPWLAHLPGMIDRGFVVWLSLLQLGLQTTAVGFLFTRPSRNWFART